MVNFISKSAFKLFLLENPMMNTADKSDVVGLTEIIFGNSSNLPLSLANINQYIAVLYLYLKHRIVLTILR